MMCKSFWRKSMLVSAVMALVATAGCIGGARSTGWSPGRSQVSPTLAPYIHFEEGDLAFFAVNTHLARLSLKEDLIPLEIAIANKSMDLLTVAPELIILRDMEGNRWPVASAAESAGKSLQSRFSRNLQPVPFLDTVQLHFSAYQALPATFGLRPGDYTMTRTVEMRKKTWIYAQIWFPNPGGALKGRQFEIWLNSPELPEPIFTTIQF
ncbi:MAG: hypothetical protein IFK94_15610 [Acidobacteria bacterium]|uniref:Lipoprotein n=1 Tax=Candidatus Polarisedimenticola svalbardensis TaxID=2886004 RepID=A0A8J6XZ14_9BACT|nr:hypothetical protein [Candidatus Polarisedimenticola svalbardensis]